MRPRAGDAVQQVTRLFHDSWRVMPTPVSVNGGPTVLNDSPAECGRGARDIDNAVGIVERQYSRRAAPRAMGVPDCITTSVHGHAEANRRAGHGAKLAVYVDRFGRMPSHSVEAHRVTGLIHCDTHRRRRTGDIDWTAGARYRLGAVPQASREGVDDGSTIDTPAATGGPAREAR